MCIRDRVRNCSLKERVKSPPVTIASGAHLPCQAVLETELDQIGRLRRTDTGPSDAGIQQSADRQGQVADDFSLDSQTVLPGQPRIVGIPFSEFGAGLRRLPVGRRSHDQLVQPLQSPGTVSGVSETEGEPIEQLGMGGTLPLTAEIIIGGDDPTAEILLPDSVDARTGSQWVVRRDQPACEIKPVGNLSAGSQRRKIGRRGSTHDMPLVEKVASMVYAGLPERTTLDNRPRLGQLATLLILFGVFLLGLSGDLSFTPNLALHWMSDALSHEIPISAAYLALVSAYTLLFTGAILCLASALFEGRETG